MSTQQADKGGDINKSTITINETAQAISSNIICQDTDRGQRRFFYFPALEERYPLGEIQAAASTARGPEIPGEDFEDLPIRFRHNLADLIDSLDVERLRSTAGASSSLSSESPGFGSLIYTPSGGSAMKKRKIKKKMQNIKRRSLIPHVEELGRRNVTTGNSGGSQAQTPSTTNSSASTSTLSSLTPQSQSSFATADDSVIIITPPPVLNQNRTFTTRTWKSRRQRRSLRKRSPRGRGGGHPSSSFRNFQFSARKQKTDNSEIIELVDDDDEEDVVLLSDGELEPGEIVSPAPVAVAQPSAGVRKSVDSEEVEIIGVTVAAVAPTPGPSRPTRKSTKRRKSSVAYSNVQQAVHLAKKRIIEGRLDASYNQSTMQRSAIQSHAIRRVKLKQQKPRYFAHPQAAAFIASSVQRPAFPTRRRWSPRKKNIQDRSAPTPIFVLDKELGPQRPRPPQPNFPLPTVQVFPEAPNFINAASDSASSKAPGSLRPIVIDGSNVAISQTGDRCFFCRRIRICVDFFKKRGHEVKVFVPQWRRKPKESIDSHILEELEKEGLIVFTPSREVGGRRIASYDDMYIVQYAAMVDGIIVSNDQFKDIYERNVEWRSTIENRLLQPTFPTDDCLMFPQDPLGRNGPSLEQFLRF